MVYTWKCFHIFLKLVNKIFEFFKTMRSLVPRSQKSPLMKIHAIM
jgi:hypothetical protein